MMNLHFTLSSCTILHTLHCGRASGRSHISNLSNGDSEAQPCQRSVWHCGSSARDLTATRRNEFSRRDRTCVPVHAPAGSKTCHMFDARRCLRWRQTVQPTENDQKQQQNTESGVSNTCFKQLWCSVATKVRKGSQTRLLYDHPCNWPHCTGTCPNRT